MDTITNQNADEDANKTTTTDEESPHKMSEFIPQGGRGILPQQQEEQQQEGGSTSTAAEELIGELQQQQKQNWNWAEQHPVEVGQHPQEAKQKQRPIKRNVVSMPRELSTAGLCFAYIYFILN
jgi:hypothetical protein